MKTIPTILLVALLICSNGCASWKVCELAKGHTTERIDISQIQKGDKIEICDHGVIYVIQHPAGKDNSKLDMPEMRDYFAYCKAYIARPRPAYYALLPLSVPVDIVIFPFVAIVLIINPMAGGGSLG